MLNKVVSVVWKIIQDDTARGKESAEPHHQVEEIERQRCHSDVVSRYWTHTTVFNNVDS